MLYTLGSGGESRPVRGARVVVALPTRNGLTVAAYGRDQIIIASYFHDSAAPIEFEDLEEALTTGHRAGEVRTYARKREFDTSPCSGDAGNLLIGRARRLAAPHIQGSGSSSNYSERHTDHAVNLTNL